MRGQPKPRQDHKLYNPKMATSVPKPDTQAVLDAWAEGVPTEVIVEQFGLTRTAIRARVSWHGVKRPSWYLSQVRSAVKTASRSPSEVE